MHKSLQEFMDRCKETSKRLQEEMRERQRILNPKRYKLIHGALVEAFDGDIVKYSDHLFCVARIQSEAEARVTANRREPVPEYSWRL